MNYTHPILVTGGAGFVGSHLYVDCCHKDMMCCAWTIEYFRTIVQ